MNVARGICARSLSLCENVLTVILRTHCSIGMCMAIEGSSRATVTSSLPVTKRRESIRESTKKASTLSRSSK